jgi:hypothetical protein
MTDFFAHLVARHRGEAGMLRPRVPFRFEPVSLSLAGAGLTGGPAAEPGLHRARADWPLPGPAGPTRPGEPWAGTAVAEGGQPAARPVPEPEPATPTGRRPTSLRPIRPAGALPDQAADTGLPGPGHADGAAPGGTRRASQGRERGENSAMTARRQPPSAPDPLSAPDPVAPDPAAAPGPAAAPDPAAAPARLAPARAAGPGKGESRAAQQVAWRNWRSGPSADPDEADVAADADAGEARPQSQPVLRPELPGDLHRQLSVAAAAAASRWPSDRRQAQDHAAGEPSGQESITVRVTIGRVEVRAAPPVARAAAVPRPSGGPSLADYLRNRSRPAGARP